MESGVAGFDLAECAAIINETIYAATGRAAASEQGSDEAAR
ncbi:hypothetical protein OB905_02190 [Halobacteria archaeon AArc-dxtr1]|nr:hypothetical protein [Halobacteria archaeon AArc-dxtr1]